LRCGSLLAFAYLFHATDASFGDVKSYIGEHGYPLSGPSQLAAAGRA
jgi:hypothetical protein